MSAEALISRLHNVKTVGPDKFVAGCPLCQSKNGRPISVRALADGRTLLHAFCACSTSDVLSALGLRFSVLYPEGLGDFKPERRPFDGVQVLHAVAHEIMVAILIASDMAESGRGDVEQQERLLIACQRMNNALSMIGESPVPEEIKRIRRAGGRS
jgi:hypothetical protein